MAAVPLLKYHDGDEWQDHTNWGENFPGGGGDNLYIATQQPVPQEAWEVFGRFARVVAKAGCGLRHDDALEASGDPTLQDVAGTGQQTVEDLPHRSPGLGLAL